MYALYMQKYIVGIIKDMMMHAQNIISQILTTISISYRGAWYNTSHLKYLNSFICPITHILYMTISTGGDAIRSTEFSSFMTELTKFGDKLI